MNDKDDQFPNSKNELIFEQISIFLLFKKELKGSSCSYLILEIYESISKNYTPPYKIT